MSSLELSDVGSVVVILAICVLFAVLLREQVPSSWPRSLPWLALVAVLGAVFALVGGGSGYLVRWVGRDAVVIVAVLVICAVAAVAVRASGGSWSLTLWFAGAILLIGLTTLPSESGAPSLTSSPGDALRLCVSEPSRWLLPRGDRAKTSLVISEFIPNVALFAPLGAGLVFALVDARTMTPRLRRILAVVGSVSILTSIGIETYQALFTTRMCSPADVMANTAGGLAGALVVLALLARSRQRAS